MASAASVTLELAELKQLIEDLSATHLKKLEEKFETADGNDGSLLFEVEKTMQACRTIKDFLKSENETKDVCLPAREERRRRTSSVHSDKETCEKKNSLEIALAKYRKLSEDDLRLSACNPSGAESSISISGDLVDDSFQDQRRKRSTSSQKESFELEVENLSSCMSSTSNSNSNCEPSVLPVPAVLRQISYGFQTEEIRETLHEINPSASYERFHSSGDFPSRDSDNGKFSSQLSDLLSLGVANDSNQYSDCESPLASSLEGQGTNRINSNTLEEENPSSELSNMEEENDC